MNLNSFINKLTPACHLVCGCIFISLFTISCSTHHGVSPEINIVPKPVSVVKGDGAFKLKSGMTIVADSVLQPAAVYLSGALQKSSSLELELVETNNETEQGNINLRLGLQDENAEAYTLTVNGDGITIQGASERGVLMGIASLRQLIPLDSRDSRIPYVTITDAPRFGWRGTMLDVSRHFYTTDQVKEHLDLMAIYKLNKFHWHLTDDQGWRIEIKQYPELTSKGAWRKFDKNDRKCIEMAEQEDNPDMLIPEEFIKIEQGDTLYGGFYTQEQIRDVVAYATERGIDVIPELDMPGHVMGAQHGYPWITCTGESSWGELFSSPLCPGKDSALMFAKNIYSEVFSLFPYEYVHLGADEVDKANWEACEDCQARIKTFGLKDENELQAWFVHDMETHFNANERKLMGWDEIVDGGLSPTATVTWWRDWAPKAVTTATAQGNKVVLSPDFLLYFDFIEKGGDLKRIYDTEPTTYRPDWNLTPEQASNIIGMQANIWCERIPSVRRMQYQIMPRMLALSEITWAEKGVRDWDDFQKRFIAQIGYLHSQGINYRIPDLTGFNDLNVFVDTAMVAVECILPNIDIRYTTDGSFPTVESPLYVEPIVVTKSTSFIFRGFRPDGTVGRMQKTEYIKDSYLPAQTTMPEILREGVRMVHYNFKGNKCAEIENDRKIERRYTLDSISIPDRLGGWMGLVYDGYIEILTDGVHTFVLTSNDGSMLYMDDQIIIDNDGSHGDKTKTVTERKALKKGWHKIRVEYFDMNNGGTLSLKMATPTDPTLKTLTGFKY